MDKSSSDHTENPSTTRPAWSIKDNSLTRTPSPPRMQKSVSKGLTVCTARFAFDNTSTGQNGDKVSLKKARWLMSPSKRTRKTR